MSTAASGSAAIRLLVVDDQRIVCDGIASLLGLEADLDVVGVAADGAEALRQVRDLEPDVVLMDIRMPVMDGIAATRQIREDHPECQVLVLTTFDDAEYIIEALQAGAAGYLLKNIPAPDLAQAIRAAQRRMYTFDQIVAGRVVAALRDSPAARPAQAAPVASLPAGGAEELTGREREVLRLLATGASNREIAAALVIAESTVKAHISSIFSRLQVRDRTQAALYAKERGWL